MRHLLWDHDCPSGDDLGGAASQRVRTSFQLKKDCPFLEKYFRTRDVPRTGACASPTLLTDCGLTASHCLNGLEPLKLRVSKIERLGGGFIFFENHHAAYAVRRRLG
jgi:hypothetical protein